MRKVLRVSMVGALAAGAIAVLAGVAWSVIPSTDGEIWACYKKSSGIVRIVDETQSCTREETRISWNQEGLQGLPGVPGEQGDKGDPGPAGMAVGGYVQLTLEDHDPVTLVASQTTVASLTLPSLPPGGGYLGTVTFEVVNNGSADADLVCNLGNRMAFALFVPFDQLSDHSLGGVSTSNSSLFTMSGLSDYGGIELRCGILGWQGRPEGDPQPEILVVAYTLSAIAMDSIDEQTPVS